MSLLITFDWYSVLMFPRELLRSLFSKKKIKKCFKFEDTCFIFVETKNHNIEKTQ